MKSFHRPVPGILLFLGFGIISVLMIVIVVVGYSGLSDINTGISSLYFDQALPIQQIGQANEALSNLQSDLKDYIFLPSSRTAAKPAIQADQQSFNQLMNEYRTKYLHNEEKTALEQLDNSYSAYKKALNQAISDVDMGNQDAAIKSMMEGGAASNARKAVGDVLNAMIAINTRAVEQTLAQSDAAFATSRVQLIGAGVFGILVVIFFGIFVATQLSRSPGKS